MILTRQSNNGRSSPQDVHGCGVSVAKGSVEADIGELTPSDVLFFGGYIAEDDAARGKTQRCCCGLKMALAHGREPE